MGGGSEVFVIYESNETIDRHDSRPSDSED